MAGVALTGLGIGSGLDTESLVTALVGIERQGQTAMQTKLNGTNSSVQNLSSVSSLLAKLKAASDALDTTAEVGSYKASSSSASIVASAGGLASPGKYALKITQLAKEQRTYSDTIASVGTALNQSGTLKLAIGSTSQDIAIAATDNIDDVIGKINAAGLRVSASSFYDGTAYRIQLRGLDTGAANAVTITETGTTFGFNTAGNTKQSAQDAKVTVDGFEVKSATNQITGAIRGVTLALTSETTDTITLNVDSDPDALKTKLQALVDSYNAVVSKVKTLSGSMDVKATDSNLAGDFTLRSLTSRLSSALHTTVGTGTYSSLAAIGLSADKTGKLALDADKLNKALTADSTNVSKLIAGVDSGAQGVMDIVSSTIDMFTRVDTGLLVNRSNTFTAQGKALQKRIDAEDTRINRYADQLRKQFTNMDTQVASFNNQAAYLSRQLG
jgi:flagellar hook-associated protein 2